MPASVTTVSLSVWRGDAAGGEMVTYPVPVREGMVVLDAILWIQANLAPDLAVRWNCKAAKCGSCSAEINGFPRLMCKSPVAEYGTELSVRPMATFPANRTPRHATNAHVSFASLNQLVTQVGWVTLTGGPR